MSKTGGRRCETCEHLYGKHHQKRVKSACDCCRASAFKGEVRPLFMPQPQEIAHYSKWCTKCGQLKKVADFGVNKGSRSGVQACCRACHAAQTAARRKPEGHRAALLKKYGLTVSDYDRMRAEQQYRCAICGVHEDDLKKSPIKKDRRLHVDHCHDTMKVRSLLCAGCNSGLARFFDNSGLLFKAFMYVAEWDERERREVKKRAA